jgi:hypothetical protein
MTGLYSPEKTSLHSILFPIFVKLQNLIGKTKAKKDRLRHKQFLFG